VLHADVDEALRLMEASKDSLRDDDGEGDAGGDADRSDTSRVYRIVKDMAQSAAAGGGGSATRRRSRRLGRGPEGERDYGEEGDGEEGAALGVLSMVDIRARVLRAGYTESQLMTTIQEVRNALWLILVVGAKCRFFLCSTRV
jgi:DNA replication licensing factor MCM7